MATRYQGSPTERQALDSYIKLVRAISSITTHIDQTTSLGKLKGSQFGVLEMLYHLGPLHQKTIGEKLLVSKSNVVAIIDKLEKTALVKRERSVEDRRCIFIHLTDSGRKKVDELLPGHVASITTAMSALSHDEQQTLSTLCRKLGKHQIS